MAQTSWKASDPHFLSQMASNSCTFSLFTGFIGACYNIIQHISYTIYFEAPHYTEPERPQAERVAIKIGKVSFGDPAWRSAPRRFGDERGGWDQRDSEILALRGITNISDLFSQLVPIICCFLGIVGCIVHIYRSGIIFKLQIKNSKPTVAGG